MKDINGVVIKDGDTMERVVDGNVTHIGHVYRAEICKWDEEDIEDSVIANGGFIRELLDPERAKEFKVV